MTVSSPRDRSSTSPGSPSDAADTATLTPNSEGMQARPLGEQELSSSLGSPEKEYHSRLEQRQQTRVRLAQQESWVGNIKFFVVLLLLLLGVLAFRSIVSGWFVAAVFFGLVVLLIVHERLVRRLHRARQAVAWYEAGLARIRHEWQGKGQTGEGFRDDRHPYAADLDLFGRGSLFELLCTARTRGGQELLASWLRSPARPPEIRARHAAIAELREQLDLREDLALLGGDVPAGVDFEAVAAWGAGPPLLAPRWPRWLILVLGLFAVVLFIDWLATLLRISDALSGPELLAKTAVIFFVLILELAVAGYLLKRVSAILGQVERRSRDLGMLAAVLARLEAVQFSSARLKELRADLGRPDEVAPSQQIARLGNLLELLESRRNQLFAPFAYLLLWGTQMAYAIEGWRLQSGPSIRRWVAVLSEFEALCALSTYAFENPHDVFPEILDQGSGTPGVSHPIHASFDGEGLGHPLLPADRCIRNDIQLGGPRRPNVLFVSGSNMSGKSTYLRTVGINAVLALAGAPVRARRLALSPLAIGATLRIQDSLQEGRSRFYAEILRVRQVVDLTRTPAGEPTLLFLLDELFAGTNSHDRRHGAEAVIRGLVQAGAIGLVTTHDLSLTQIADDLGEHARNVHFADHFENGVMKFDYQLQPGVVRHSNAIALMRAVGLEV